MKTKTALFGAAALMIVGWAVLPDASPATAIGAEPILQAVGLVLPAGGEAEFVGSNKCKKCHITQHKSWKKTPKFNAMDALQPGNASEIKSKHDLDPQKDYTTDAKCLACHTTGYGHPGGYAIPEAGDEKKAKEMKKLAGVGCESCHGAGGAYIELHEEIMKSKRTYKVAEMYAAGMTKIEATVCTTCHNEDNPTYDASKPFDFAAMKDKGGHDHSALKQRAD